MIDELFFFDTHNLYSMKIILRKQGTKVLLFRTLCYYKNSKPILFEYIIILWPFLNKRVIRFSFIIFQLMFLLKSCMIYIQSPISKKIESILLFSPSQRITNQNIIISYNNILNTLKPANKIEMRYITQDIRKVRDWNIPELDLEKDILLATNMARTNPSKFSDDFIQPLLKNSFKYM